MTQGTRQLTKTISSQAQGVMMMMMMIQRQHNHLPQGLHQHHTSQGGHIILMKSMKCPLYHKSRVEWHTPQESQHGSRLLISIQMQMLRIWKLL